jgi:rare lipoprotein A (peptidoglycan hydrolase)
LQALMTKFMAVSKLASRTAVLGCTLIAGQGVLASDADAKSAGTVHCYNDICHRVRTVEETTGRRGMIEAVVASFYDSPANDRFNPRSETSSGAIFDADMPDNAASPIHPDGTVLLIWSPVTRGAAVVRVNNAGPYYPGRTLDVSRATAEKLGFSKGGVMQLLSVVISAPSEPESRYQRGRVYPKVRGYLGTFDNLALASLEDPAAREAIFASNQPLPMLALNPTQQLLLTATEQHIKARALAEAFAGVPPELVAPPDLHISMVDEAGEMVPPEAAALSVGAEPPVAEPKLRVLARTVTQVAMTAIQTLQAPRAPTPVPIPPPAHRVAPAQKAKPSVARVEPAPKPRPIIRPAIDRSAASQAAFSAQTTAEIEDYYTR